MTDFSVGDEVFYAGALNRPGSNAQYQSVDERLVGHKPRSLSWAETAALPLTSLTAWEMLFDRLSITPSKGDGACLLIIGGGGGVSSMAIQLARLVKGLTVIATASRPQTRDWVTRLGAHYVIDYSKKLAPQIAALPVEAPRFIFSTQQTQSHWLDIIDLVAPQGHIGLIDDPPALDALPLKTKSLSLHWELMFTRSLFGTSDQTHQGEILEEVARLVEEGTLQTTLERCLGPINAVNLRHAHALIESGQTKGKIVLEGFDHTEGVTS